MGCDLALIHVLFLDVSNGIIAVLSRVTILYLD